ncbi:hypothetical protein [Nocardia iowensis]|uniref:DUF1772 domain-containing protein n=1 Tax=Nocardia iowensis TaxID=204891 RepID=A0ABX8RGP9_NOCIO|nr:hypothetical protein [Nocardia iowensis]QXN88769.1 hypothetical protein KV110_24630 [Nocardia iowensis]
MRTLILTFTMFGTLLGAIGAVTFAVVVGRPIELYTDHVYTASYEPMPLGTLSEIRGLLNTALITAGLILGSGLLGAAIGWGLTATGFRMYFRPTSVLGVEEHPGGKPR